MIDPTETLGAYFLAAADRYPDRLFLRHPGFEITYRDAAVRVAGTIVTLRHAGLSRGDYIACYIDDQVPTLFMNLACALSGIIPAPLAPTYTMDYFLEGIVEVLKARAVFSTFKTAKELLRNGIRPFCYAGATEAVPLGVQLLDEDPGISFSNALDILASSSQGITTEDTLIVSPTSGSTGAPKLVVRQHIAPVRYAHFVGDQIQPPGAPPQHHRFLMIAALTHAFGLHMLTTAMRLCASLCVTSQIDTAADLDEVRRLDPTVLPMVPRVQRSFYHQWLAKKEPESKIFGPSAAIACSAGGSPTAEILQAMEKQGLQVIEFYGSTEASVVAVSQRGRWKAGSQGKPVSDATLKFAPDGELLVRSPGVTPGYFGDESLNQSHFTPDGFYATGDFAELTIGGSLKIVGRKRDVFNTPEGANIYPERIENIIEAAPWAKQVILIGDQKPYLAALISIDESLIESPVCGALGYLPEPEHRALYDRVGADLANVNEDLQGIEQVRRFALFNQPLSDVYSIVGPGKVRRERKGVLRIYGAIIDRLYTTNVIDSTVVPENSETEPTGR